MLVARRDPFHVGAQDAAFHQRPDFAAGRVPRFARAITVLQVVGSLLAIPVGLASAYSMYRANFSVETTCESLRANIFAMIDKNVDAGARRILVRRDVEKFEQTCGAVDPDAKAAFKVLLAADRPAVPPTEKPRETEPRPDAATMQPAAKANPVVAAAPTRNDAAVSDRLWLDAVRQALLAHGEAAPAPDVAKPPVVATSAAAPALRSARPEATLPAHAPAFAAAPPLAIAPALPPATTVATPAMPQADDDHPLPPASIPDPVPPANADAAKPGEPERSRIGKWIAHVPLLSTVIGIGWR
jgi:hypothetical protein